MIKFICKTIISRSSAVEKADSHQAESCFIATSPSPSSLLVTSDVTKNIWTKFSVFHMDPTLQVGVPKPSSVEAHISTGRSY